ncbi:MarR family transcriptional regulator [Sneathiella marina]|uniref:MarR family transcriptional regulator n=1 Tax=Sneathiella marina TaxID=2950108 RepID=A0ABY4W610_9PROT|nr:MarR family transcriptional regulator [Sneathiella marina]USG62264.1 MarR family transcriptional regulator [Sneathiella marina]
MDQNRVKELIDRLARINSADEWAEDINPVQWTALSYLVRANRFSRSPSQVSDFMTATRGTVSQTLKALARKGLVKEVRSDRDRRSISYSVTKQGQALFQKISTIEDAASLLNEKDMSSLLVGLEKLVRQSLRQRGLRPFGVCKTCIHHRKTAEGGFCDLLREPLSLPETNQICHEQAESS